MKDNVKVLFDDGEHKFIMFSFDDESHEDSYLSVNQYMLVQNDSAILIDPGSEAIFDELYDAVSEFIDVAKIKMIFFSHQDPDVSGSIAQWAATTSAKFVMSALWVRFMSHYGFMDMERIIPLADHGAKLKFGDDEVKFLPAHFLHSPGQFSLYDVRSKILFTGDIGAAILPSNEGQKTVLDFEEHAKALEGFHKRYMASNKVCRAWVKTVRKHEIDMIVPQHGFAFEGENVEKFLSWMEELQCGSDMIHELY
jgi:flavorubredoxin